MSAGGGGEACVRSADTGPGIPDTGRERVFDRFYRVGKARGRVRGGSGPGLSPARAPVRAHAGSPRLDREDGRTRFTVRLPA
ncbi:ATP-binding protein [Streptomyces sp. MMG1121]|uniref:ATP-binding protein n=1 Tax=Streptomyces sp. MMG1121 TaxID=1415544 RepID=UPI002D219226|nr:ATP-binding protein [Streptomyces sp. MMG1121]